jgi:hypothetical protein
MKILLLRYRLFFIIGIPFLFFVLFTLLILLPLNNTQSPPVPAPTPSTSITPNTTGFSQEDVREGNEESVEERPGLLSKEALPDNNFKYTYRSPVENRPHIIIAEDEYTIVFQRMVTNPRFPVKITDYTDVDGPPKWIFKGSVFYGPDAQTYVYPELGLAFIADPRSEEVFEQHLFDRTTVEDYVRRFGEDIPANPEP